MLLCLWVLGAQWLLRTTGEEFDRAVSDARAVQVKVNLESLETAVSMFREATGEYPVGTSAADGAEPVHVADLQVYIAAASGAGKPVDADRLWVPLNMAKLAEPYTDAGGTEHEPVMLGAPRTRFAAIPGTEPPSDMYQVSEHEPIYVISVGAGHLGAVFARTPEDVQGKVLVASVACPQTGEIHEDQVVYFPRIGE